MLLTTWSFAFFQATRMETATWFNILGIAFVLVFFYFVYLKPQVKEQKTRQNLVDNLKKGDKVITSGGIWGEVDSVDQQIVRLKVSDKAKIMVSRSAVTGMQPSVEAAK